MLVLHGFQIFLYQEKRSFVWAHFGVLGIIYSSMNNHGIWQFWKIFIFNENLADFSTYKTFVKIPKLK